MMSNAQSIDLKSFDLNPKEQNIYYSDYILHITDDVEEPAPLLSWEDNILFSECNISTIGGAAKSCKTFFVCYLAAKYLEDNISGSILLIDTEQARSHTMNTLRRIYRLVGWDMSHVNERLTVLSLREVDTLDRVTLLEQAIEAIRPKIVFVDGVRDLVRDFNNADESSIIVNLLMRLSSLHKCHICSVLHENKVGGQLRGHLGSELINKSETVIGISREDRISTVKPLYTRNRAFDEFYFRISDDGLPELCQPEKKPASISGLRNLFTTVMPPAQSISATELKNKLTEFGGFSGRTAERKISQAANEGVIQKNEVGYYYLVTAKNPEYDILPF